jgi:uncharacterized membrane protein
MSAILKTTHKIALAGLLSSLAVALGFLLMAIPNVELITLVVFVSGSILGVRGGALVGVVSMLIYSIANPMGTAIPLVTVSQAAGQGIVGALGATAPRLRRLSTRRVVRNALFAAAGVVVTLQYDLLTNLALGASVGSVLPVVIAGLLFSLVHVMSNAMIFFFLVDVLLSVRDNG